MAKRTRLIVTVLSTLVLVLTLTMSALAGEALNSSAPTQQIPETAQLLLDLLDFIESNHVAPPDKEALLRAAIEGMFRGLGDPYSAFLSKEELSNLTNELNGEFGGIGVRVELINGIVTVTAPIPGTPAAAAGLRAGDQIVAVDGTNCIEKGLQETTRLIRGEPGSKVTLTIRRGDTDFEVAITRAVIKVQNLESRLLDENTGYIHIVEFTDGVSRQFADTVSEWQRSGKVDALILDLRDNPGGLLTEAVSIISDLAPIDAGAALWIQTRDTTFPVTFNERTIAKPDFRLVVLVNGGSASASEIVAAAIQDYGAGTLVGTKTYGKGTVQQIYELQTGDGVKLTVARYYTPRFRSIDGVGLTPDVIVEEPAIPKHEVKSERPMAIGLVGLDVLALEQALDLLGLHPGAVDGVYDENTRRAVALFQLQSDLTATGTVDDETLRAINYTLAQYDRNAAATDLQLNKALEIIQAWRKSPVR